MDRVILGGAGGPQPTGILHNSSVPTFAVNGARTYDTVTTAVTAIQVANGTPDRLILTSQTAGAGAGVQGLGP